jgi:hypothetical protein
MAKILVTCHELLQVSNYMISSTRIGIPIGVNIIRVIIVGILVFSSEILIEALEAL